MDVKLQPETPEPHEADADTHGLLLRGEQLFNSQKYFDAHEVWEDLWRESVLPDKRTIQALVQIAAAMHHYSRGNCVGAQSLTQRGLQNLADCSGEFRQLDIDRLRCDLQIAIDELKAGSVSVFQLRRK